MPNLNKQELHNAISATEDKTIIPVADFITVYGNDNVRKIGKKTYTRADILAERYGLTVQKVDENYEFTK